MALKHEAVVESWNMLVINGEGKSTWFMKQVQQKLKDSKMPGVHFEWREVSSGLFGAKRDFIVLTHSSLRDYVMYIAARNFGSNLDISWYLTIQPRFLKRTISKYTTGNPQALSWQIDFFTRQDLDAIVTGAHACVKETYKELMEELKQDPTGLNTRSKGFLSVW
jgi:hypothetical protein